VRLPTGGAIRVLGDHIRWFCARVSTRVRARGVAWFIENQEPSGLWNIGHNRPKGRHSDLWVGLAVCRMLNAVRANHT